MYTGDESDLQVLAAPENVRCDSPLPVRRRGRISVGSCGAQTLTGVIAILGAVGLYLATPQGLGITNDSVSYLRYSRVIIGGEMPFFNNRAILRHYPPGYPALLSAGTLAGLDTMTAARWINVMAQAGSLVLVGMIVWQLCDGAVWAVAVACWLMAFSHVCARVNVMLWSELLSNFLFLACMLALSRQLDAPGYKRLIIATILAATACLIRYANVSLIGLGVLSLLALHHKPFRQRIFDAILFGSLAITPLVLVAWHNLRANGEATGRTTSWNGIHVDQLHSLWSTVATWVFPNRQAITQSMRDMLLGALVVLLVAVLGYRRWLRHRAGEPRRRMPTFVRISVWYVYVYLVFLLVSLAVFDPTTPLDDRILSPLFILGIVIGVYGLHRAFTGTGAMQLPIPGKIAAIAGLTAIVITMSWRGYEVARDSYRNGFGFNHHRWRGSNLMAAIRAMPASTIVYSNVPGAVYFVTGHDVFNVPIGPFASRRPEREPYVQAARSRLSNEGAIVAIFNGGIDRKPLKRSPSWRETARLLHAEKVCDTGDGVLMIAIDIPPDQKAEIARLAMPYARER